MFNDRLKVIRFNDRLDILILNRIKYHHLVGAY